MHTAFIHYRTIGWDCGGPSIKDGWIEKNGRRAYVLQNASHHVRPEGQFWYLFNPGRPSPTEDKWSVLRMLIPTFDHLVISPSPPNGWVWPEPDAKELLAFLLELNLVLHRKAVDVTIVGWKQDLSAQKPYLDACGIRDFKTVEIHGEGDNMQGLLRSYLDEGDIHYRRPVVGTCCPDWMCIG